MTTQTKQAWTPGQGVIANTPESPLGAVRAAVKISRLYVNKFTPEDTIHPIAELISRETRDSEMAELLRDYVETWKDAHTNCARPSHCLVCRAERLLADLEIV